MRPSRHVPAIRVVLPVLLALGLCTASYAETIVFKATTDFPDINAGEVPYYVHSSAVPQSIDTPYRHALAINAGIEDYRDKFARATTQYTGTSGFFDITIIGLAELDGEAQYRLFINDVLIDTAQNPEVETDYTPVRHIFEDIVVPSGATLAVESLANTNGKIPEGDGTAFARGRWTALELYREDEEVDSSTLVDLSMTATLENSAATVGEQLMLSVDITNLSDETVATAPVLTVTRPRAEVGIVSLGQCTTTGNDVNCPLSELAAGASTNVMLTLEMLQATPSALLRVAVVSDQTELTLDDNALNVSLTINAGDNETEDTTGTDGNESTGAEGNTVPESTEPEATSSSGGALSWQGLLISFVGILIRIRRRLSA